MAFRVTRPPQVRSRRPFDSDSEEERPVGDELVSGYNAKGSIRFVPSVAARSRLPLSTKSRKGQNGIEKAKPLVIPSQPNADWREIAKQRRQRAALYLPEGARVDGRAETPRYNQDADVINAQPVTGGLKVFKTESAPSPSPALTAALAETSLDTPSSGGAQTPAESSHTQAETDDQLALKELLGGTNHDSKPKKELDAISIAPDALRLRPPTEEDAFKMDVEGRPEVSTIEDYERVPIEQFGAALLRGMGWKPSESQQAVVPQRRSALLGLGAKESSLSTGDDKSKPGRSAYKKPEPRFMPLVRKESESARSSQPPSRDRSHSPVSREASEDERRRRRDREYDSDRDRWRRSRSRSREYQRQDRYSDDEDRRRRRDREDERRHDSRREYGTHRDRDPDSRRYERGRNGY